MCVHHACEASPGKSAAPGRVHTTLWKRRQPRAIPERLKDTLIPLFVTRKRCIGAQKRIGKDFVNHRRVKALMMISCSAPPEGVSAGLGRDDVRDVTVVVNLVTGRRGLRFSHRGCLA
jgi:hypothetical protein